jgi:hypothetical protein
MNRAPVNGPVDDPTCNYNTGRDKPGESVSSSPGQTSAETAEPTFPSYQIPNRHHIRTHRSIQSKRPLSRRFMPVWLHHRANPAPGASVLDYTELVASPTTRRSSRNVRTSLLVSQNARMYVYRPEAKLASGRITRDED